LTWRWSRSGGDPLAERPVPDLRGSLSFTPAAVVGATVGVLVLAFFVTLFMPLADPTALEGTTRTAGRELEPGTLAASGRSQYIADGCVTCHTQRVRAVAGDERYGPPSLRGDYGDGPALAGERRMGPDLMWVGDRYGSPAAMAAAMAVHAAGGPVALPWLLGPTGPTVDGAAVTDYLLRLTSTAESGP